MCVSCFLMSDSVTPWTVAYQVPPSMGFSRQEYWSALPSPSPEDLPNPGIKPMFPALQADALPSEPPGKPDQKSPKKTKAQDYMASQETSIKRLEKRQCLSF